MTDIQQTKINKLSKQLHALEIALNSLGKVNESSHAILNGLYGELSHELDEVTKAAFGDVKERV